MADNKRMMMEEFTEHKLVLIQSFEDFELLFPFDLQLFAAEDEGRTEEPTEKKIRESRDKGQVAKTQELPQALVVIFSFMVIFFIGSWVWDTVAKMTIFYLTHFSQFSLTEKTFLQEFVRCTEVMGRTLLPIFIGAVIAAILGNVAQVGFQFTTHPLKFDLTKIKITPADMMRKIFFSRQVMMNLLKSLVKMGAIGFICYLVIMSDVDELIKTPDISIAASLMMVSGMTLKIVIWSSVVVLVLAIPDYFVQRAEHMESLKMSKQEIKQELRESQGDPHLKGRLKQMQREILTRTMIKEVPKADVIVTNPTHFAVALRFNRDEMSAPMVIAKGVDSMALKIREIAKNHDILMVENRPLAQELYKRMEVGDFIPEDLYKAVSFIYAEVYKKKNSLREAI